MDQHFGETAEIIAERAKSIEVSNRIRMEPHVQPENYWINTSSRDVVKQFIQKSAEGSQMGNGAFSGRFYHDIFIGISSRIIFF